MISIISSFVLFAAIGIALFATIFLYAKRNETRQVKPNSNGDKIINLSRAWLTLILLINLVTLTLGLWVILDENEFWAGLGLVGFGLFFALLFLPIKKANISVGWNDSYIEGPNLKGLDQKSKLYWEDVISINKMMDEENVIAGTFSVKSKTGQTIYVYYRLSGWGQIIRDVRKLSLDIDLSDFD